MAKESYHLVVVDHSQEYAQEIDSLLRNSGIALRVTAADSTELATLACSEEPPFLFILGDVSARKVGAEPLAQLAAEHHVPMALRASDKWARQLEKILPHSACQVFSPEQPKQLIDIVQRAMASTGGNNVRAGMQEKVDELEGRFNQLLDSAREAVAYIHEGLHVYANGAYLEVVGAEAFEDIQATSLLELLSAEKIDMKPLLRDMGAGEYPAQDMRMQLQRADGSSMEVDVRFSAARFDGESCTQMMLSPVVERSDVEAELDRLRHLDPVTELLNRQHFIRQLGEFLSDQDNSGKEAALVYFEPDGMDQVQENLGLVQADAHLSDLAKFVREQLHDDDLAGRIGDHGLAMLIVRDQREDLEKAGQAVVSQYRNHIIEVAGQSLTASCSAGLALLGSLKQSADEIIALARKAHVQAADEGNQLVRYRPKFSTVVTEENDREWSERIRFALNHQDFYSVQHSIVDLEGEGDSLIENRSFMREEGGDRGPEEFFPPAERADLAGTIDRHLIPGLLSTISDPSDRHFISISGNSIADAQFAGWLNRQLQELGIQGSQIILQVATPVAEKQLKPLQKLMKSLEPSGCRLSLAQFNGEKSAERLLDHLDITYLKLDETISRNLVSQSEHQETLKRIVRAADQHDVEVVADEVQDSADLAVLWQCGVKLVTGEFLKEAPQVVGQ